MVWAAFDRAVRAVERHGLEGDVARWRELRDRVREEVLTKGFDPERGSFRQHYDTSEVDAALLMLPLVGFIEAGDPRMVGTVAAIEHDLMRDGLLLRYRTESGVDGLPGDEHPFLACSFWLVSAYAGCGRLDEARALFDRLVGLTNDVGLLSEEYDAGRGRMVGNFPQAFSHLALVQAAFHLRDAAGSSS
jgi:GH15 family glucan-1,4-alpha-glucosidase